jgi:hypothetical protein
MRLEKTLRSALSSPEVVERNVAMRLSYYVALQEMLGGRLESARDRLEDLRRQMPPEPDWLQEGVLSTLVDVHRMLGNPQLAEELTSKLPEKSPLRSRLERRLREPAASEAQSRALVALQPALRALYAGDPEPVERALNAMDSTVGPFVDFYRGEIELLRQHPEEALSHYARLGKGEPENLWNWFQFFAFLRMAEAHGALHQRDAAAKSLDQALETREQKDLLRHVVRARKGYFERDESDPGSLFRADLRAMNASTSPQVPEE